MNQKHRLAMGIAAIVLVAAILACGPGGGAEEPSITIASPASGTTVQMGQSVQISSVAADDDGITRVELLINGQVVRTDTPPSGSPTTFSLIQPWTPIAAGQVTVSVIAYDTEDNPSEPAAITVYVETTVADVTPTPEPDVEGPGGCSLNGAYAADVTIPDDTQLAPGTAFVKTWRIRNSGTCAWGAGFTLVFVSGDQMGAPGSVAVPATAAGSTVDVSVNMVAPTTPGTYRGNWRLRSDEGELFGSTVYVRIVVPSPVTPTPTTAPPPQATPFGGGLGRFAFVSFRDGNAEIYVKEGLDGAPIRLTNSSEIDDWPDWSPDGARIAFTRYSGGKPDIYVMNADGSSQTNITNNAAWDSGPDWSPDGTRIAFDSDRVGGVLQIWVMRTDGTSLVQLTNTPQINSSPDWSPDGNRIAFESNRDGQREIYVMNSDGGDPTRLTFTGSNYGPHWSPDGSRIVFSSSNGLWSIRSDGTQLTQLTINAGPMIFDMHPAWSPDGTQIVFDSRRSGNQDLYVINADGTGMQQLTTNPEMDTNATWR